MIRIRSEEAPRACGSSRADGEEDGKNKNDGDDNKDRQRKQAALRPLHLRPPHRLNQLLPLNRRLRQLPVGQQGAARDGPLLRFLVPGLNRVDENVAVADIPMDIAKFVCCLVRYRRVT